MTSNTTRSIARTSIALSMTMTIAAATSARAAAPPWQLALDKGTLAARAGEAQVLSALQLRLRTSGGQLLSGALAPAGSRSGRDRAGAYSEERYRWQGQAAGTDVVLALRRYEQSNVLVGLVELRPAKGAGAGAARAKREPLAGQGGLELGLRLDGFGRGMALERVKPHWTAPVFVDDPSKLPANNLLLLWQKQQPQGGYQLLVPLAGGGMIGHVGATADGVQLSFSSGKDGQRPRRVPLFALVGGDDPYQLAPDAYRAGLAAAGAWGKLREEKAFPEIFRSLGWCSWNTYYKEVSEQKVLASAASLKRQKIPVGFVLVDDGWQDVKDDRVQGLGANEQKFPSGLKGLARSLRDAGIPHVGVWRTLHGYWSGMDPKLGKRYPLLCSTTGLCVSDPRAATAKSVEAAWAKSLASCGIDFLKVDNQSRTPRFCEGQLPVYDAGHGIQRQLQESVQASIARAGKRRGKAQARGGADCPLLNCMSMTLDNAFNWRYSNLARNSDDYEPDKRPLSKRHVLTNAYNALWTSVFAYPDFDMFQSHDRDAEYHAVARAVSGGPIYFTDAPGQERPDVLRRLALGDGRLLLLDGPGQVTRDLLLTDPARQPVALKIFGRISRPGVTAGIVGAFNVNGERKSVQGALRFDDVERLTTSSGATPQQLAVFRRGSGKVALLDARKRSLEFKLPELKQELFTVAPVDRGVAVLGLLDKYLGPAAVRSAARQGQLLTIKLEEPGELGLWLERAPSAIRVGGRTLDAGAFQYREQLLRIPRPSFGTGGGPAEVQIELAR